MVNWTLIWNEIPNLASGAGWTLFITFFSLSFGVVLGLFLAILRLSRRLWLRLPAAVYVEAVRGTPMLVQILLIWFGLFPMLGLNRAEAYYAGISALALNSGAYLCEIFRGGIQSIDRGQREAALSLGMSETQVMVYVILPQALANALPAIGNEFVTLIKDSSLVSSIAVAELTYRAMLVAARRYEYFTMYVGIALMYFVMTFTTSRLLAWLESRLRRGSK